MFLNILLTISVKNIAKDVEKQENEKLQNIYNKDNRSLIQIFLYGGWPLLWGGIALALLNFATLLVAGHPWSVTFAFGLWGAKILSFVGVEVSQWEYWSWSYPAQALKNSVLNDSVSLTNFGLIIGAMFGLYEIFRQMKK